MCFYRLNQLKHLTDLTFAIFTSGEVQSHKASSAILKLGSVSVWNSAMASRSFVKTSSSFLKSSSNVLVLRASNSAAAAVNKRLEQDLQSIKQVCKDIITKIRMWSMLKGWDLEDRKGDHNSSECFCQCYRKQRSHP